MRAHTLAHLSDLHLGHGRAREDSARALVEVLEESDIEHVVVTGDITHRGRDEEMSLFLDVFGPLHRAHRLTVVPGNHDRTSDDAGRHLMGGRRVLVQRLPGLLLVQVDSTTDHNRSFLASQGELTPGMLDEAEGALGDAPAGSFRVVLLHHHPLALPEETWLERWSERLGLPYCSELPLGRALLERVRGRCDLILHGHRHVPREIHLGAPGERPLTLYNAGSSTDLGRVRVFSHLEGMLQGPPRWLWAERSRARGRRRLPAALLVPRVRDDATLPTLAAGR